MFNNLYLYNFSSGEQNHVTHQSDMFVLKTCQRTLWLTFFPVEQEIKKAEILQGREAYLYLLETITGLKSRLIGENEIVGQFKEAYKIYSAQTLRDPKLMKVLEKIFKDSKDIRSSYFSGFGQKTYASLTRKHFSRFKSAQEVVILGSGQLALDLVNQLKKKIRVVICARNEEKVKELCEQHKIESLPWENRNQLAGIPFIANTIGTTEPIFSDDFFSQWVSLPSEKLWVDLSSPSPLPHFLHKEQGFIRLQDILDEGAILESHKYQQIALAKEAMVHLSHKRALELEEKLNQWHPSFKLFEGNGTYTTIH